MQKEINFYQEMASEHRLQENGISPVPPLKKNKYSYFPFFAKYILDRL